MAENSSDLLPWMYGCISEAAFARENDAVTRALRMSLLSSGAGGSRSSIPDSSSVATSMLLPVASHDPSQRWEPPAGRIAKKRKSRTSKRSPTTYITADPDNFRQLVQQITGPQIPIQLPLEPPPAIGQETSCLIPTLDTSAFLVGRPGPGGPIDGGGAALSGTDPFPPLPSFPTLDSWGVM